MISYFVLELKGVLSSEEDVLTDLCFSFGASGISENLQFRQESLRYEPETVSTAYHDLEVYFPLKPDENLLLKISRQFPNMAWNVREELEKDWLEEWKRGFEPFCLAGDVWIVPSWSQPPSEASKKILLDPGMAFGTGTHATTQLAACFLADINLEAKTVLDVGTGTGILAMASALWGAKQVGATEIDIQARSVARDNVKLNKINTIEIYDEQIEGVTGPFDVVVANIIDGVLVDLRRALMERVAIGGDLVLSGILLEREDEFVREFEWEEFHFIQRVRLEKDEWVGFHLSRALQ